MNVRGLLGAAVQVDSAGRPCVVVHVELEGGASLDIPMREADANAFGCGVICCAGRVVELAAQMADAPRIIVPELATPPGLVRS